MVSYTDDKIGRLMKTLRDLQMDRDTIIVFTSDHGEMLGERGMWFKMNMFEWSVRVPMIIHAPDRYAASRVSRNVSLVDLLPTLVQMGGGNASELFPDPLDGKSLCPLAEGVHDSNSPDIVISDFTAGAYPGPIRMVKHGVWKLIRVHGHPSLLFNLADDPDELHDLAGDPTQAERLAHLTEIACRDYDPAAVNDQVLASQRRRLFIRDQADPRGVNPSWAYAARPGDETRFVRGGGIARGENATKARARFPYVEPPREG